MGKLKNIWHQATPKDNSLGNGGDRIRVFMFDYRNLTFYSFFYVCDQ